ncbi:MAG TPA: PilZ domain-containing protein, partial [Pseudolabrys sp.]
ARVLDRGFVMTIAATNEERARLADRIDWHEKNKNHDLSDGRKHKRIMPKDPRSTLVLADESRLDCFVIDMSPSGVAVSADIKPKIGTPLAVGTLVGRVVRHLADGFAVQFIELQDIDSLEQRLIQS